jgi:hypothetical protein
MTPTTVDGKKEKKRKNKEDEAAVAATLNLSEKKVSGALLLSTVMC